MVSVRAQKRQTLGFDCYCTTASSKNLLNYYQGSASWGERGPWWCPQAVGWILLCSADMNRSEEVSD